ncbi:FtsK/SpoIIIE domain-containing protein [Cellulomonas sp. PhB150]|uniref:FtsK/SpoIIIE domain-containing protein n=1 Tax=Cellulomonas sp. PhB150 TaxID=2485188 RepID=UPI000F46B85B|nr:FtsK/SpoIIIE domain-containing protein [Cellulomonas sp. PhB150]ROS31248.1 S-DNA-T family DNA segregation ATPase FtsK/SpoIIIE [Cellulomonas sp. PhB150]
MRLTLSSPAAELDVEVDVGACVGDLRPHLARLTGEPGWAAAPLTVGGRVLDDSHAAGHAPLVGGAVVRLGPGLVDAAVDAVRAPWHVAVLAGPAAGALVALRVGDEVRLEALRVRARGRGGVRGGVRVRGAGRGPLWRRWRVGSELTAGASRFELRTTAPARAATAVPTTTRPGRDPGTGAGTWLAPLVGAGALAAVTGQPLFLAAALAVPLAALAPRVVRALRRRRGSGPAPTGPDPTAAADLAAVVARSAAAADGTLGTVRLAVTWGADGSLAVVGPRAAALARAREIAVGAVGSHAEVDLHVRSRAPQDWRWARWAAGGSPALPDAGARDTVVVDDGSADLSAVAGWRRAAEPRHRLLLVLPGPGDVPAWCGTVEQAEPGRTGPTAATAEDQVRRAIAARGPSARPVPDEVALGALDGVPPPSAAEVAARWEASTGSLAPVVGRGPGGSPARLDLARDGPHVLVGGTTGAGKSELLVSLVLACALAQPPERLAVLLVDFKGGTGLGPVAGLPHVVDHVSDLDPAAAARLLVGLRAELRRRERVLAGAGARDLRDLDPTDPATPPRLLVVVDELRAVLEDVPDAAATLARLAALGRSLGVHLVLATQRPAGAVGADLRANVSLRIALRVADDADSTDLIDVPDAARIDPRTPGRALVRAGDGTVREVQVARAVTAARRPPVRIADDAVGWSPVLPTATDDVAAWVGAARSAAGCEPAGAPRPTAPGVPAPTATPRRPNVPWLPALPVLVHGADLDRGDPHDQELTLALADEPAEQRRGLVRWGPDAGHLLVVGGPRSGRTTALLTIGTTALLAGRAVHTLGLPPWAVEHLARLGGRLGTVATLDEPRLLARLLRLLADDVVDDPHLPVLLVDGLEAALESLGRVHRGAGADLLTAVWRGGPRRVGLVASGDTRGAVLAHAPAFRDRLVLPVPDAGADVLAGVPTALLGPRGVPGRAIHLDGDRATLCQVALPLDEHARDEHARVEHDRVGGRRDPIRLRPLPVVVDRPAAPAGTRTRTVDLRAIPLGIGGDTAHEVGADLTRGVLVAGPVGSGRTTTLSVLAAGALAAGARVLTASAGVWPVGVERLGPSDLVAASAATGPAAVVLVDDLDELERDDPSRADALADLVASAGVRVVAAATAGAAAGAYRGVLATLLRRRTMVVLDPSDGASAELVGPGSGWLADVVSPPGRAVAVQGRRAVPVQVYRAVRGPS